MSLARCLLLLLAAVTSGLSDTIMDELRKRPELSKFLEYAEKGLIAPLALERVEVTVFAPTNDAFDRYRGKHLNAPAALSHLFNYHYIQGTAINSVIFPNELNTLSGRPIYLNKVEEENCKNCTWWYVNQARIIEMDIKGQAQSGIQFLHIIDQVLDPLIRISPSNANADSINPTADMFMRNPSLYGLSEQLNNFKSRVDYSNRQNALSGGSGSTFFLPIDSEANSKYWTKVDERVIDGHIIPDKVLFTTQLPQDETKAARTAAFVENLHVVILLVNRTSNQREERLLVQSSTLRGEAGYPKGIVEVNLVRGNIPVKNGVVHLIQRPLIIVSDDVKQLLSQSSQISSFYSNLEQYAGNVLSELESQQYTVLAPLNEAFQTLQTSSVYDDRDKFRDILLLHLIPKALTTHLMVSTDRSAITRNSKQRSVYFAANHSNVTVRGDGFKANIVTRDMPATNGVIHIIDRVLGIPCMNVYDTLQSIPELSFTLRFGEQGDFNRQFKDKNTKFTYFVPNDKAWEDISEQWTSEFYRINDSKTSYHVEKILQRHLIAKNRFTLKDLMSNGTGKFNTVMGELQLLKAPNDNYYFVQWENKRARVEQQDIETTNGIIHILNGVLMTRSDLTVGGANPTAATIIVTLFTLMVTLCLIM